MYTNKDDAYNKQIKTLKRRNNVRITNGEIVTKGDMKINLIV